MGKRSYRNSSGKYFVTSIILFIAFIIFILVLKSVDIQAIGPLESRVGLATINGIVKDALGVHMIWYEITEVLGIVAILVAASFALLGGYQLITRRSLMKVDRDIIALGVFYVVVVAFYVFFEKFIVNYRPVILETELEASFPSSHTMVAVCIMGSAMYQFYHRINNLTIRNLCVVVSGILMVAIMGGRMISGVHWFTDIMGGIILSGSLIFGYIGVCKKL
ncbi:hypothetical protein P261_00260 [Lachnospiraceae bacterium TWA4]|nr:hypothetical protein P261_00260 [Lachnospiraceae bacterium TWA4]